MYDFVCFSEIKILLPKESKGKVYLLPHKHATTTVFRKRSK